MGGDFIRHKLISFDLVDSYIADIEQENDEDTKNENRKRAVKIIKMIIENDLTVKQKRYVCHYFFDGMKMTEIAQMYGIVKSTVSRTISVAIKKINSRIKYYKIR
ncbi:MAG: sigma-70 family RNA polymerase sigma factor [Oscillospiraceae bacterium]